jgi:hypothetical protein
MTIAGGSRPAVATAVAVVAAGALLGLDRVGAVDLDWGWGLPLACLVAGAALLAVAPPSRGAEYAGTLTRLARSDATRWWLRAATVVTAPVAGLGVAA